MFIQGEIPTRILSAQIVWNQLYILLQNYGIYHANITRNKDTNEIELSNFTPTIQDEYITSFAPIISDSAFKLSFNFLIVMFLLIQ